jgi:cytoskeletal protein CcmA (bactofilin family)
MFGKTKQPAIRTLIGEGTIIRGELHFSDGLRVDGEIHGDVIADSSRPSILVVSDKARVVGQVKAGHVIVNGSIEGPITAEQLLELQPKAVILGDVRYLALEIHQGARVDGELRQVKVDEKPALKLAATNAGANS